ncbi:TetR/AcrR family transcriptional regulator [Amphibacillus sp. Q70]|uniref:TetR/AcrR family transcriptional regulator n=1 Tax=Amphibacillus sp. Q70 TaxID=3453416 RepID=UPI003F87B5CA
MNQKDKQQALFDAARALFLKQGFKKTNISAITEQANVAVGTFYKYYSSKEQIFNQVYQAENEQAKRTIISQIDENQPPKPMIQQFLKAIIAMSEDNLILAEWYQNTEVSQMLSNYNQEADVWKNSFIYSVLIDNIKRWQASGQFRKDIDLDTILALFNALVVVDIHKEEVGSQHYPQVLELLADMIVDGLSTK